MLKEGKGGVGCGLRAGEKEKEAVSKESSERRELKMLPRPGCEVQMLGVGVNICFEKILLIHLNAERGDKINVGGRESLGSRGGYVMASWRN